MNVFLLLLHLTSTVHGILTDETPPTVYAMEEGDSFSLQWDSPAQTNSSLTNMICFLLLTPPKVLYRMMNGAVLPESQDGRFSGRVELEGDALREGRLRLRLSRLRTEDSGRCLCYLDYLKLQTSVTFVLNVTKTSDGAKPPSVSKPKPELPANTDKQMIKAGILLTVFIPVLLGLCIVIVARLHHREELQSSVC